MRRSLSTLRYAAIAALFVALPTPAEAADQHVTSQLSAEGYSVLREDGTTLKRRRFVEDLGISLWNLLPGSQNPYYRGPRLSIAVDFRLNADAGIEWLETRPSTQEAYVPGATPLTLQLMQARLSAEDLWDGHWALSAGRLLRIDSLGLFALDGAQSVLSLPLDIEIAAYLGFEVRGGHVLGYDSLELDGTDSGGRDDLIAGQYKDRSDPEPRLAMGAEFSAAPTSFIDVAMGFRAVGLGQNLADERIGGSLVVGNMPLRAELAAIYSVLLLKPESLDARLVATVGKPVRISVGYELWNPIFESDSIFNMFDLEPRNDLVARIEARLSESFGAALWTTTRLARASESIDGKGKDSSLLGLGGGAGVDHRTPSRHLALRLSTLHEWGEQRSSGEIGGEQRVLESGRAWVGLRTALWRVDDDFRPGPAQTFGGYVASFRFAFARGAEVLAEVEHYMGGGKGSRLTGLALWRLDLWR